MSNTATIHIEINKYLKELCLSAIKKDYEEIIQTAVRESLSYDYFLFELLSRESLGRRNRRIERYLRQSHLPLEKKFENFDMKLLPLKVRQQIQMLCEGDFLNRKENVLVFGKPGSGKTHLLCALGQKLVENDRRIYFTTCSLLVQELLIAKRELKLPKLLKNLQSYEAIIIDDFGYIQQSREEMEVLFTLLAVRYERGSVMITSNLPFSKWEIIFKDPMTTASAIDRLVHHSVIIELNIESYRMKEAKRKVE